MLYTYINRLAGTPDKHKKKHVEYIIKQVYNYVLCVCVFFPFILDIKFVGRTSRGHTGRRKVTQDFSSTFFLRCVP